jgi:hypothetical protein
MKAHKHQWVCVDCGERKDTPKLATAKGIEGLTELLDRHGIRRFNLNDPKAVKAAEATPCVLCAMPLKFARLAFWWSPLKTAAGYAHVGCVEKAETARDRIWAQLDAARHLAVFDADKLDTCVCEHKSARHESDSLENLLQCSDCACTHFRCGTEETAPVASRMRDADGNRDDSEMAA